MFMSHYNLSVLFNNVGYNNFRIRIYFETYNLNSVSCMKTYVENLFKILLGSNEN